MLLGVFVLSSSCSASAAPAIPCRSGWDLVDAGRFTVCSPVGWHRSVVARPTRESKPPRIGEAEPHESLGLRGSGGEYFQVVVDGPPRDGGAIDVVWTVEASGDHLAIVQEGALCGGPTADSYCGANDGRLAAMVLPVTVKGVRLDIGFGNSRTDREVSMAIFREILLSIRVK
jgi:hypothetical protein